MRIKTLNYKIIDTESETTPETKTISKTDFTVTKEFEFDIAIDDYKINFKNTIVSCFEVILFQRKSNKEHKY